MSQKEIISIYPFPISDVRKIFEMIIKPFHLDPLQARCYFLDLLKIQSHTFYQIRVNFLATNSVDFPKPEDTERQLAAEHHSAQLLPAAVQIVLKRLNLRMLEHIIGWVQHNITNKTLK